MRCSPRSERSASAIAGRAADRRRGARRARRAGALADRRQCRRRGVGSGRGDRRAAMAAAQRLSRPGRRRRSSERAAIARARRRSARGARGRLIALLQGEGGKTLDDALAEVREAVDFCRYYAAQARTHAGAAADAGADRRDQRAALSRPRRVRLHQPVEFSAGDLPRPGRGGARRRQCGGGQAGRADAADRVPRRCGCCTRPACRPSRCISCRATARSAPRWSPIRASPASPSPARPRWATSINRALAAKDGPIVPLIAETGGINAMIVDATALPEQVTDDVSPRRSARPASAARRCGCSACRRMSPTASSR